MDQAFVERAKDFSNLQTAQKKTGPGYQGPVGISWAHCFWGGGDNVFFLDF